MFSPSLLQTKSCLFLSLCLGSLIFTSCASASYDKNNSVAQTIVSSDAIQEAADVAQVKEAVPQKKPQLIKKARMTVIVKSLDKSVDAVEQVIDRQKGYLISLEERQLDDSYSRPSATVQMRVPQNLLETTLSDLAELGTVQSRNISAEDVGEKIVDFQARLSNLRRTESNLQKIMDKSGSVKDILSVAQELSKVREQIERITAQLKSLQNQVTYSTITLDLEAAVSITSNQPGLPSQIQDAWNNSTSSFGVFTVGLMKLGIWLIVYTPYLLILVAVGYFLKRKFASSRRLQQITQSRNSENN
jgi:vacuolar-type H+-ATPase subunit I/STV1